MEQVNIHEAKTHLSRLVASIESGETSQVVIARNGRPVVKMVRLDELPRRPIRLGLAEGKFRLPDDFDAHNEYIGKLMTGEITG